jgi:hypothetical protein
MCPEERRQEVKREQLIAALRQIEQLVANCLEAAGEKARAPRKHLPSDKPAKNTLPQRISELRDKGFFAQPRTARDVHAKLSASYPCELNRVEVALPRLGERKKLRKASKLVGGKKQAAYVW